MASRRQHTRDLTFSEIRKTARDLLVAEGQGALTVIAVARRMGMTGPALYRYYASHDELMAGLTAEVYREVTSHIAAVCLPDRVNLLPMCRALRRWALANREPFRLIFANPPLPAGPDQAADREDTQAARAFGQTFFVEVESIWKQKHFPVRPLEDIDPTLAEQLVTYAKTSGGRLPPPALQVFLYCWIRLYGLLCMEVLGQIDFAISNAAPLFEDCLMDLCHRLGIDYVADPDAS